MTTFIGVVLHISLAFYLFTMKICAGTNTNVTIAGIFEASDYDHLSDIFYKTLKEQESFVHGGSMHGVAVPALGSVYENVKSVCGHIRKNKIIAFLVMGNKQTINSVNLIAEPLGIPVLAYSTGEEFQTSKVPHSLYLQLEVSWRNKARGLTKFFSTNFWFEFLLIIEETFVHDGFYDEILSATRGMKWSITFERLAFELTDNEIKQRIHIATQNRAKIIVLHASVIFAKRIFGIMADNMTTTRHSWFITEASYSRNQTILWNYPEGALTLMNTASNVNDILQDIVAMITDNYKKLSREDKFLFSHNISNCDGYDDVSKLLGRRLFRSLKTTHFEGLSGHIEFDKRGALNTTHFVIKHLIKRGRKKLWQDIGYVRRNDVFPFGIVWPTETISNQIKDGKKRYRIVTNPVRPFVFEKEPNGDYEGCARDTVCLKINTKDKEETIQILKDYENGHQNGRFQIRCCRGLTIDLLNRLSRDLNFDYTLYIVNDVSYGKEINGTWNGMVHDLMTGTAHMAVAAFSITRERLKVIDFTHPYFFSGFSVLYSERKRLTRMHAFLEPFSIPVWIGIFISATIGALSMALFEWNSPFGLNPWGRKRKQNYTIASGLTMVYSVLFGHTVKTKSPKAWPSKVMQNTWAIFCIFVISSYTANLAAFIAGKHAGINYGNVFDSRLLDIRVGVLEASAVEAIMKQLNERLYRSSQKHYVPKSDTAIEMLIDGKIDAYLGDYPILEYARGNLDPDCQLRLLSHTFGEDGYGIGIAKDSPLKKMLSEKIKHYHEIGYIEDLIDVHFADADCYKQRITSEESQLEVPHHAGLFVMLSVGILVGLALLVLEYVVFRYLVPRLRLKPATHFMKSTHLMFLSQRLHRVITSPELISANESAKEMLGIVRNREFSKLFMKSTIRKNKLADMAKTKRINRNFMDIIEKAKWMQEMRESNLFGEDDSPDVTPPCITEVSLKDVSKIDLNAMKSQIQERQSITDSDEERHVDWFLDASQNLSPITSEGQSNSQRVEEVISNKNLTNRNRDNEVNASRKTTDTDDQESGDETEATVLLRGDDDDASHLPNGHVVNQFLSSNSQISEETKTFLLHTDVVQNPTTVENHGVLKRSHSIPTNDCSKIDSRKKRKSWQATDSNRKSVVSPSFTIDDLSKEELLLLWKVSEMDLDNKLEKALREKSKLEQKVAKLEKKRLNCAQKDNED